MHKDCIILCHDVDANGDLLCLKEINGKPFIEYLTSYFAKYHICKVIFSISHQGQKFKDYILSNREIFTFAFDFSENKTFDGSGTAIINSLQYSDTPDVLIMHGHRFFDVNLDDLIAWQQTKMGDVTLALTHQDNTQENLLAHLNEENHIHKFSSGTAEQSGLVVAGVYCIFRPSFLNVNFSQSFSFEQDYLQRMIEERDFIGMISDGYYTDMAIEQSIEKATKDFPIIFKESVSK